jgi:hypothetical protein
MMGGERGEEEEEEETDRRQRQRAMGQPSVVPRKVSKKMRRAAGTLPFTFFTQFHKTTS